jgi:predicted DNA-binding transcriptional regulator YafY
MVYQPTSRVLTVLELLQARPGITGPELAGRLEVDRRTVRRYITTLQDLGVPVEGARGRHGGYRLKPGYKLPPLMLTDDEALAISLGLLLSQRLGLTMDESASESASSKLGRVLPIPLREQARSIREVVSLAYPESETLVESRKVGQLTGAAGRRRRVRLEYRAWRDNDTSSREVDPYGLVYLLQRWYLVGYCHLREDLRMFRLDRIERFRELEAAFEPPEGFDCMDYAARSIGTMPGTWGVEVRLAHPLVTAQDLIPATHGSLSACEDGTLFRCTTNDLDDTCRFLVGLGCDFTILGPEQLRARMRRLARRLAKMAGNDTGG